MKLRLLPPLTSLPPVWPFTEIAGCNLPLPRPRDYELRAEAALLPPGETRIISPPGDDCWLR